MSAPTMYKVQVLVSVEADGGVWLQPWGDDPNTQRAALGFHADTDQPYRLTLIEAMVPGPDSLPVVAATIVKDAP